MRGSEALLRLAPAGSLDPASIHMDVPSLAFLATVSLLTGIVFGIVPALGAARLDPNEGLKEGGRSMSHGSGAGRNALVIVEFALALVLLMGAGLLIRSFARLLNVDPGFRTANLLTLRFEPSGFPDSQTLRTFYERLETRLRSLPGVKAVVATSALPLAAERAKRSVLSFPARRSCVPMCFRWRSCTGSRPIISERSGSRCAAVLTTPGTWINRPSSLTRPWREHSGPGKMRSANASSSDLGDRSPRGPPSSVSRPTLNNPVWTRNVPTISIFFRTVRGT